MEAEARCGSKKVGQVYWLHMVKEAFLLYLSRAARPLDRSFVGRSICLACHRLLDLSVGLLTYPTNQNYRSLLLIWLGSVADLTRGTHRMDMTIFRETLGFLRDCGKIGKPEEQAAL